MTDLLALDSASRQRALDVESFIVEAPAGAGKTELLTQRYLKLLALVAEPEEIVAITFTNKAAAEMRGRILDSLQDALANKAIDKSHKQVTRELALQALKHSDQQGWALLAQPGRLRITTIDSLNGLLARQMPLLSRFGAQPATTEDAGQHYAEAARRTLAMLEAEGPHSAIAVAMDYFDNDVNKLAEQLALMLQKRDQWLQHSGSTAEQESAQALQHLVGSELQRALACLPAAQQNRLMPAARYAAANLQEKRVLQELLDWQLPLTSDIADLPRWRAVCALLLTDKGTLRKSVNVNNGFPPVDESKPYKELLVEVIAGIAEVEPLARIQSLPDTTPDTEAWRIIAALSQLLQQAAAQLTVVFQQAGEVDFIEVGLRALRALEDETGVTDLALQMDYRIRHLLVDEFQDTSPTQIALLQRLTAGWEAGDGRTLFCVGDPMQSIYRFRKADVGLFLQVAGAGIGHLRLQRLQLALNNRSRPAVIDWVNRAFTGVLPLQDNAERGAIAYREFVATRDPEQDSGVSVHALLAGNDADKLQMDAMEAAYLAALITRERAQYPGRSIAVLVRARSHLHALVAEIRRHHRQLDFQAVEVEALAGRQSVQDALALTRALLHRADRVNWLAILRAPWCGLTLADLYRLAARDQQSTVWQLMQREELLAQLTADGRQRLLHVRGVIAEALAEQGRQPLRRWIEAVWLQLGGPQCLVEAGDVRDVQAYFDLVEKLARGGQLDVAQLERAMAELYAAPDVKADGNLQFMTLHKSKGLQFDTVILPGLHRQPPPVESPLLLWESVGMAGGQSQLLVAPWVPRHRRDTLPSTYDYLKGLEKERSANEAARVLYVGATRTERRLHLLGVAKPDSKGELKPASGSFLQMLWDQVGAAFLAASPQPRLTASLTDETTFTPRLWRLPQPAVPAALRLEVPQTAPGKRQEGAAEAAHQPFDADCGSLAHRYLEIIARQGLDAWPTARLAALQPAMQQWLQRRGHALTQAAAGSERVHRALSTTLQSKDGRWLLQTRPDAAAELAIANAAERSVIDRTFVEQGVRWVIDYKSAGLAHGLDEAGLQQLAESHRPQLQRYAALFADAGLLVRQAIFFMAAGRLLVLD